MMYDRKYAIRLLNRDAAYRLISIQGYPRTTFIEANQRGYRSTRISKDKFRIASFVDQSSLLAVRRRAVLWRRASVGFELTSGQRSTLNSVCCLGGQIILANMVEPIVYWLLAVPSLFGWITLVGVVRAEFLRAGISRLCVRLVVSALVAVQS